MILRDPWDAAHLPLYPLPSSVHPASPLALSCPPLRSLFRPSQAGSFRETPFPITVEDIPTFSFFTCYLSIDNLSVALACKVLSLRTSYPVPGPGTQNQNNKKEVRKMLEGGGGKRKQRGRMELREKGVRERRTRGMEKGRGRERNRGSMK